jgi:hypothetical protein
MRAPVRYNRYAANQLSSLNLSIFHFSTDPGERIPHDSPSH